MRVENLIYPDDVGIAYVGLMNLADPQDKKTLPISVLLDRTRFRLVVDLSAAAEGVTLFIGLYDRRFLFACHCAGYYSHQDIKPMIPRGYGNK